MYRAINWRRLVLLAYQHSSAAAGNIEGVKNIKIKKKKKRSVRVVGYYEIEIHLVTTD
jgi:hypothetical protein